MPNVDHANASLYYEVSGTGPRTITFAHGAGGNAASWWQQTPYFVAQGYRVITFDHRGFGRSRCAEANLRIDDFVGDLGAILDAENVQRTALVCQSMGGWTGVPMTLAHPERIDALALCGTPGGIWTTEVDAAISGIGARLAAAGGLTGPGGAALGERFKAHSPTLAHLYDQISAFNIGADTGPLLAQIPGSRIEPSALADFTTPTLVIAGHLDVLFPLDAMRSVAAAIPGARIEEFAEAGHSTYFEDPDRFNELLAEFLANCAP